MNEFLKTALSVSTPRGLAALSCTLIFLIGLAIIRAKVIPALTPSAGAKLLKRMVDWLGALAIVVVLIYGANTLLPFWSHQEAPPKSEPATPISSTPLPQPTIDIATLKNLTYVLDGEKITLRDGKREFGSPDMGDSAPDVVPAYVYLTDWAFGDITGDGSNGAVAVLQKTDGGSGIYYYLVPVTSNGGKIQSSTNGYTLGDRLAFKSIEINSGHVNLDVLMHRDSDPGAQPSWFRHLDLAYVNGKLVCQTKPCSEIDEQIQGSALPPLPAQSIAMDAIPSFDCGKAKSATALAICNDEQLRELDGVLGNTYHLILAKAAPNDRPAIRTDEQRWITERDSRCASDSDCIRSYLQARQNLLSTRL